MIASELGYTKDQVVDFWTTKLANKIIKKNQVWNNQISELRNKLNLKFDEQETLKGKKSTLSYQIETIESDINEIKDQINSIRSKIEKFKTDCDLQLQNINQFWNDKVLVQACNFSGVPVYFFIPYAADATLDFNQVIVTYLNKSLKPNIIEEQEALSSGYNIGQQLLISTGGKITV